MPATQKGQVPDAAQEEVDLEHSIPQPAQLFESLVISVQSPEQHVRLSTQLLDVMHGQLSTVKLTDDSTREVSAAKVTVPGALLIMNISS